MYWYKAKLLPARSSDKQKNCTGLILYVLMQFRKNREEKIDGVGGELFKGQYWT